jgi:glycosyltransferase involved in cell wall biosynthesis
MLSVVIPGRHEEWFSRTVEDVLKNIRGDSEVVAICDEVWPDPPLQDHPKLTVIHFTTPVGQRGGMNMGARVSRAKYIAKLDAHCAVDEGFDVKLMAPYEDGRLGANVTTIPRLYNFWVYDWQCQTCKWRTYQGRKPEVCPTCKTPTIEKLVVWEPRKSRRTDFARFDNEMHFQYWPKFERRPETVGDLADVMSSVGACFFMRRDRFWALGGMDEATGSWGQFGTEIACKAWLSGGRQVVNKTTWYSHYFRVNGAGFPYTISGNDQERAKKYSRDMWLNDKWPLQTRPLKWLVDKFSPVPGWEEYVWKNGH